MNFPITRDDCPACGSKERLGRNTIDRLIELKHLSKDMFPDGLMMTLPLIDQKRIMTLVTPTVKLPILNIYWDICKECLTMYCTKFELVMRDASVELRQQKGQPPSSFSPS